MGRADDNGECREEVPSPINAQAGGIGLVTIYPNPTTGTFTVKADGEGTLSVCTPEGKEVTRYVVHTTATTLSLPHGLAAGLYFCRYNGNDGQSVVLRLVYNGR